MLLVVDLPQRVAAPRARLAKLPVDEVDVLVALARDPQLERARQVVLDRRREPLDLGIVEVAGERERRELGSMEDLVRVRPPDPGERALVAQQRVQPPVVAREDLAQLVDVPSPSASGPRCASSASVCSGDSSQTPARFFGPASVSTSSPPFSKRSLNAGVFGPLAPEARCRIRPALIRWTRSWSALSAVGKRSHLPRLPAPAKRLPSSSRRGGSNVFSVAM